MPNLYHLGGGVVRIIGDSRTHSGGKLCRVVKCPVAWGHARWKKGCIPWPPPTVEDLGEAIEEDNP